MRKSTGCISVKTPAIISIQLLRFASLNLELWSRLGAVVVLFGAWFMKILISKIYSAISKAVMVLYAFVFLPQRHRAHRVAMESKFKLSDPPRKLRDLCENRIKKSALINVICGLFLSLSSFAQNYPVQLTTQLSPPFSGYLNDYLAPDNQQLKALILFTDFTKPSYNIKLKFKLSGQGISIESKPYYYFGPVNIQPGVPFELAGSDLAELLNPNNLDFSGISLNDYNQRKVLPEGFYEICFTAYDFSNPSNIQVSQQSCATAWMVLSDPPYLNLPMCGNTVNMQNPQQVLFQWTPMNLASPNSAFNTEYEFSLYEVRPNDQNPNFIIQTLPPIYQFTTTQTSILYGLTEPVLYVGQQYVWRVRAKDITGRDAFRNNGYSQICTFMYGNSLSNLDSTSLTLNLRGQALTHMVMGLDWDSLNIFSSYKIEFCKAGTNNWYPMVTDKSHCTIGTLEPGQTYNARVKGVSNDGEGPWSNTVTVPLPTRPVIVCGQGGVNPLSQNIRLLTAANPYMIWEVGQFDMVVTQLYNNTSQTGKYSGMGKIEMPFLGINLNCTFTNITVSEMMQVINGEVNVVTQGVNSWVSNWQNSHYQYDDAYNYNGCIDSVFVNSAGQAVIVDCNGTQTIVPNDTNGGLLITDSNGNQWVANSNGTVNEVTGGMLLPVSNQPLSADEMDILKKAFVKIKNEYTANRVDNLYAELQSKENIYANQLGPQFQNLPSSSSPNVRSGMIGSEAFTVQDNTSTSSQYKKAELDYNAGKLLRILANQVNSDEKYNFIGQYLIVNSQNYKDYITAELGKNRSHDDIATDVADLGLKQLVRAIASQKMKYN